MPLQELQRKWQFKVLYTTIRKEYWKSKKHYICKNHLYACHTTGTPLKAACCNIIGLSHCRPKHLQTRKSRISVCVLYNIHILKVFTASKNISFLKSLKPSQAFQTKIATENSLLNPLAKKHVLPHKILTNQISILFPIQKPYLRNGTLPTPVGRHIPNRVKVKAVSIRLASAMCFGKKDSK